MLVCNFDLRIFSVYDHWARLEHLEGMCRTTDANRAVIVRKIENYP